MDKVRKNPKLWERLGAFLKEIDAAKAEGKVALIGRGRFRILKGNLAEALSMLIKLEVLRKKPRGSWLISNVRVRLKTDKGPKMLFSDDVIATLNKHMHMSDVFEVKAGREGDAEVTEQIFEWIEGRLQEGSQVIIPKGSILTRIGEDGTVIQAVVSKQMVFTWYPKDPSTPRVTKLASAPRHRITTRGTSALGLDSEFRVAPPVSPRFLDERSDELDYLAAQLCLEKGVGTPP
jgi:hypothetical protein